MIVFQKNRLPELSDHVDTSINLSKGLEMCGYVARQSHMLPLYGIAFSLAAQI